MKSLISFQNGRIAIKFLIAKIAIYSFLNKCQGTYYGRKLRLS